MASESKERRRVADVGLPVFVPVGKPKTRWIWCSACHKYSKVPIYRIFLCTYCYKKGDASELQRVTGKDRAAIADYVRKECAGEMEDGDFGY